MDDIAREQVFRSISDNYSSIFRLSVKSFSTGRTSAVGFLKFTMVRATGPSETSLYLGSQSLRIKELQW